MKTKPAKIDAWVNQPPASGKIAIKDARVYWNETTMEIVVGTIAHPATREHRRYDTWICAKTEGRSKLECIACLLGELLWLAERGRIDLKAALPEVRKIDGVCEWLDEGRVWI